MTTIPLVRVTVLRPIVQSLAQIGAPVHRYLERAAVSAPILERPETFIPLRQAQRFLSEAANGEGIADLGLVAGEQAWLEDLGIFGQVVRRSHTLGEALMSLITLATLFNSGERWWTEVRDGEVHLSHQYLAPILPGDEHSDHYGLALAVNLVRHVAGASWVPGEVRFQSRYAAAVADSDFFRRTTLRFSQPCTAFTMPVAFLQRTLPKASTPSLVPRDVDDWRRGAPPTDLAGGIRQVIAAVAPRIGHPRIEQVAAAVGFSIRTLQRRLSESGISFEQVVQAMRLDMAADLLARTDARILDIALDLGYSDHAHFTRAFRTWTGVAPLEYRRQHRPELASRPLAQMTA